MSVGQKQIHRVSHLDDDGNASALCFARPRVINLRIASWTNRDEAVTCPRCIAKIEARKAVAP